MGTASGQVHVYRSTARAWSDGDLADLLSEAGFGEAARCAPWPCNTDALRLEAAKDLASNARAPYRHEDVRTARLSNGDS